jgi:hypothetical protein
MENISHFILSCLNDIIDSKRKLGDDDHAGRPSTAHTASSNCTSGGKSA